MGKPALTAAWHGILIAPGMAPPAPIISPLTRGIFLFGLIWNMFMHTDMMQCIVYCIMMFTFLFLFLNMNSLRLQSETVPEADI